MERLWSPWRLAYLTGGGGGEQAGCIFCRSARPGCDELVVARGRVAFVILNLYPYNNGHLMIVPNRHVDTLQATSGEEREELMRLTRYGEIALSESYKPQGFNVGINLGRPAGAGVLGHLHIHLVPRWNGDTNFMSTVGNTRVLPEELPQTAARLRPLFERLMEGGE